MALLPPVVEDHENSLLFMAEVWATGSSGTDLKYEIVRSPGFTYEAIVTHHEHGEILRERISLQPTMNAWITDLLNRAEKASKQ